MNQTSAAVRSIVLSYVRAALVFAVAAVGGGVTEGKTGAVLWSIGVGAAWAGVPAALRAAQAFILRWEPKTLPLTVLASLARAGVGTGLMTLVGPLNGSNAAFRAFLIAVVPAVLRALQEVMDQTAPASALARLNRTVTEPA